MLDRLTVTSTNGVSRQQKKQDINLHNKSRDNAKNIEMIHLGCEINYSLCDYLDANQSCYLGSDR
jgi:hypothetical protein